MRLLPSVVVALVACLPRAQASPLTSNPVTVASGPLDESHPAFGAPLVGVRPRVIIMDDPNAQRAMELQIVNATAVETTQGADRSRWLEETSADITRLEEYFRQKMERNWDVLTRQFASGKAPTIPWPGSYWPTYQDSINYRFGGQASPAERYAKAFGYEPTAFMNKVSLHRGIDLYASSRKKCTSDGDCTSLGDGSKCAKRFGQNSGYCIPTWWGICHAWAPAAILEAEPKCPVTKNGVTFRVFDVKALMTALYDGAQLNVVFTGARFDGPDSPPNVDKYGRYKDAARRDLGPGFFHIAVTNIMGKFKQSFVVDVNSDSQVWNQPVREYTVTESRIVDIKAASMQYFGTATYPFNAKAVKLAYTKMRFRWIYEAYEDGPLIPGRADAFTGEQTYEYLLELDASNNIIGGEWLKRSQAEHPDFLWFVTAKPNPSTVTAMNLSYKEIRALLDASVACRNRAEDTTNVPAVPLGGLSLAGPTSAAEEEAREEACEVFTNSFFCGLLSLGRCSWQEAEGSCRQAL